MSTLAPVVVAAEKDPARAEWSRAAQDAQVAAPRFVDWSAVTDSQAQFQPGEVVFAERLYPGPAANPVGGQRRRYADLQVALEQLDAAVAKGGATPATPVEPTLLALDRVKRDEFLRRNGVPVLETSDVSAVGGNNLILRPRFADCDDWVIDRWRTRLFRHRTRTGFEVWRAPGHVVGGMQEVAEVAGMLVEDGIHAVESLYRVHLDTDSFDFRFAVLDGKVTHAAGVRAELVILREWYGGRRSEIDAFVTRFGAERWSRLVALAERAATLFPGIRSLGVDVILDNEKEFVFDVDPFGAALPGLVSVLPQVAREPISVRAQLLRSLSACS